MYDPPIEIPGSSERQMEEADKDDVLNLVFVSPRTGKGMLPVSPVHTVNGESVLFVGNRSERWKVTLRVEELTQSTTKFGVELIRGGGNKSQSYGWDSWDEAAFYGESKVAKGLAIGFRVFEESCVS